MSEQTNPHILPKEIEKLLDEIATEENFKEYEIKKIGGSIKGEGYLGIITNVKIKEKANTKKVLSLIIKSASENKSLRNIVAIDNLFRREVYMYETIFKTFQMFEVEKGLSGDFFSPKFYKAQLTSIPEVLILENLKENGFKLYDCKIPMDDIHLSLVMSEYGRFHALSFALRDQNPKKFDQIIGSMDNHIIRNMTENNFIENFIQQCKNARRTLDSSVDKQAVMVYENFLPTINSIFQELSRHISDYAVALHGDCWTNNMMFKYEDQNKQNNPTKVSFFDFQLSTQGSPVLDVSYFFYTCSNKEMLNNLNYYLNVYYDSFSKHLRKLGSDPEKVFPFSVFQEHWKRFSKYGLIFSLLVIHIMLTENEKVIDLADVSESGNITNAFCYEIGNFEEYKNRVRPIILHFVENNFI